MGDLVKKRKILVVVDVQNDFIDGSLGNEEAVKAIPNIVKKIKEYKNMNADYTNIIVTKDTHFDDSISVESLRYSNTVEGQKLPIKHCIEGTKGWEIREEVAKEIGEDYYTIIKYTFGSTYLADFIKQMSMIEGVELEVELIGFCTDICVISNALLIKAHTPNIKIVVDASCCAGTTPENHKKALDVMQACHIDIINE